MMAEKFSGAWRRTLAAGCIGLSLGSGTVALAGPPARTAPLLSLEDTAPAVPTPPGAYGSAVPMPQACATASTACKADVQSLLINLPTALSLANAGNPTIALARERVREAYAHLREAEVQVLPNLRSGPAYQRHDGQIQNSTGIVFTTSKSNFFIGGGAVLALDTSEAIFGPLVARRLVQAQTAASQVVTNNIQLDVALAYLDLLRVFGALAVNADTLARAEEMLRDANIADQAGVDKTKADPNRARTEVMLRRQERLDLQGQAAVVSARLAQLLLLEPTADFVPAETAVVPIALVPVEGPLDELVAAGLLSRPELAESRALVGAALARWRQARLSPLIPRLEVDYLAGDFGGGRDSRLANFDGRGDGLAQAVWELHNLGAGDVAQAQARRSQYNQSNLHVIEVQAQVAAEVTAAAKLVRTRQLTLNDAQEAVRQAEEMWRKLRAVSFGVTGREGLFDILQPLLAEQALNQARTQYLTEVIEYNRAQFRLYWAMGQPPLCALPKAAALPVAVPVKPSSYQTTETAPQPRKQGEPSK